MMGVDFPVHHVVACQRLVLCFLRPMFCDNPGDWPGWKVLWMGCGLQGFAHMSFPMGLWITGLRSWWRSVIFLTSLDLSERLVVLGWVLYPQGEVWSHWEKQLVAPFVVSRHGMGRRPQGKAEQAMRQGGLLRQWVVSIFYSIMAKTQGWRVAACLGWVDECCFYLCVFQRTPVLLLQCLTKVQFAASLPFCGGKWCSLS